MQFHRLFYYAFRYDLFNEGYVPERRLEEHKENQWLLLSYDHLLKIILFKMLIFQNT
jgi:hypothetical protein